MNHIYNIAKINLKIKYFWKNVVNLIFTIIKPKNISSIKIKLKTIEHNDNVINAIDKNIFAR